MDHLTGRIRLDHTLLTEMVYPADSGFIENTLGLDGEPLDAHVLEISDVAEHTLAAIQNFCEHYADLEPGTLVMVEGCGARPCGELGS
jgi:inorganic pyrophosphatase